MSGRSSRRTRAFWEQGTPGAFRGLLSPHQPRFSWLRPSVLWRSRNDVLIRRLGDPTDDERRHWVAQRRREGAPADLRIDRTDLQAPSLLVLGDTGEGDASQFAVVPGLLQAGADTDLMVICSDVIYPCGDAEDYEDKFYWPYKDYPAPIYAVPGNHDWYDGLAGFMLNFCDSVAERRPAPRLTDVPAWRNLVRRLIWRRPIRPRLGPEALSRARALRGRPGQTAAPEHRQPGPYWALETGPVLFVGIDAGIRGDVDAEQLGWLREISASTDKPKVLLTGKPLYVDGGPDDRASYFDAVDAVVRDPRHNYVAAIGGDIHNFQRYPVPAGGDRTIQYVVAGAGGAYTKATHTVGRVTAIPGCPEEACRFYPRRGDSLALYSRLYDKRFAFGTGLLSLSAADAEQLVQERLGIAPTRGGGRRRVGLRARLAARIVYPLPSGRGFHKYLSEFFDWDTPPFFKSFLRLDVEGDTLRIRCFAATGWREEEDVPPREDDVTITLSTTSFVEEDLT